MNRIILLINKKETKAFYTLNKAFYFLPSTGTRVTKSYWQDSERQAIYVQQNSVGSKNVLLVKMCTPQRAEFTVRRALCIKCYIFLLSFKIYD